MNIGLAADPTILAQMLNKQGQQQFGIPKAAMPGHGLFSPTAGLGPTPMSKFSLAAPPFSPIQGMQVPGLGSMPFMNSNLNPAQLFPGLG